MDAATSFLWGKGSFVSFCFVLSSFTCFLFVEGWERVVCVWFVFPPLVFLLLKHTEGTFVYSMTNKRIVRTL